jgi:hypothetical protein
MHVAVHALLLPCARGTVWVSGLNFEDKCKGGTKIIGVKGKPLIATSYHSSLDYYYIVRNTKRCA